MSAFTPPMPGTSTSENAASLTLAPSRVSDSM